MSTKQELIDALVDSGYNEDDLGGLSEEKLGGLLSVEQLTKEPVDGDLPGLDEVEITESEPLNCVSHDNGQQVEIYDNTIPKMTSSEWTDYVLTLFESEELYGANPKVDGLRRVTELLIGEIVSVDPEVVQVPSLESERATVVVRVQILRKDGSVVSFGGAADACPANAHTGFEKYPVALAETRAEARAYRKALRLRVAAAEEIGSSGSFTADTTKLENGLTQSQVTFVTLVARRLNVDVEKLVKKLDAQNVLVYNSHKKLSETDGHALNQALSALQNGDSVPEELLGYSENWSKSL